MSIRSPILSVNNIKVYFGDEPKVVKAVEDVSFELFAGEALGIVGESGCGKSTIAKALLGLAPLKSGEIIINGHDVKSFSTEQGRYNRRHIQMIFQDPLASLNPRYTIEQILNEPLNMFFPSYSSEQRTKAIKEMMSMVGLNPDFIVRYPHEFSGGQCQRIAIARSMLVQPDILVCDEAVSALDVSIQGQIINLLKDLQKQFGLSLIFISHNLNVVRYISNRVMVLYLGKLMEEGKAQDLFENPKHPYTKALLGAIPKSDPKFYKKNNIIGLGGDVPSPIDPPSGCVFHTRCPMKQEICVQKIPPEAHPNETRKSVCHFWEDV